MRLAHAVVVRAEVIDFDHHERHGHAVARGAPPFALEKFLKGLLNRQAGDRVEIGAAKQLVLDKRQFFIPLVERRPQRLLARAGAPHAENVTGGDQKRRDEDELGGYQVGISLQILARLAQIPTL